MKLINKIQLLAIFILLVCSSCFTEIDRQFSTKATIFLINETTTIVKSDEMLGYIIQPGDTLIHKETDTIDGDRPSINQYFLSFLENRNTFMYDEDKSRCEEKIYGLEFYENRKEVAPLEFEFTFRFTEEKKAVAESCND